MKPLDLTKPLQTRLGQRAEIVYDGLTGEYPLAVVVYCGNVTEVRTYRRDGVYLRDEDMQENLLNVPERGELWVNVYPDAEDGYPSTHRTREDADNHAFPDRIACVRVEYEDGEGL